MRLFIEQVWETYDVSKSGALDFYESKRFIKDILGNLPDYKGTEFSDETFRAVFQHFDTDGSQSISKEEMVTFIKELLLLISAGAEEVTAE